MGKDALTMQVKEKAGLETKAQAAAAVEAILAAIGEELARGGTVSLKQFGTFSVAARAGRTGKNPRTGEPLTIAPSKTVKFSPGKDMKEAAKASDDEWGEVNWLDYRLLARTMQNQLGEIKSALAKRGMGSDKLQGLYDETASRLKELSTHGGEAFQEMRKGVSAAFAELREAFKKAVDRF